ncbi:hypothetical protein DICPUDRAFT_77028 [Dictyostelium purpureum]|uniref:Cytochrome b5 heme-binding domain-containing protein n=1 Tax=Dictyostelium purpureum TaxID=5786 RepID=F0ZFE0_DICPU|nr:uncharacterized protein DICPUDRAFT_77028 [Dictyostelium purpureum]EGC37317.1 hypothetical protein DICPUDRAFT_77028 [Dictyostelium purpureum]|eukprot:XP_003286131.1 hypothetical protein DICPUDRAFT_77028 [Dictyostelium purpureum]
MIENSPSSIKQSPILVPTSCSSCCCNSIKDIEDTVVTSKNSNSNNNGLKNSSDRKIIIEQKVSKDQPLAGVLNNISNSLHMISNDQLPQAKKLLENLEKESSSPKSNNKSTTKLVCVCQQSSNLPFCDSSHIKFNKETNSNIQPIYLTLDNNSNIENNNNNNNNNIENNKKQPQLVKKQPVQQKQQQPIIPKHKPGKLNDPVNQQNYFSLEEISTHNSLESCWMIIQNKVYDITAYIDKHPGGKNALLRFAGKDGTDNVQFHSAKMLQILNNCYFIGHVQKDQQTVEPSRCSIS